MFAYLAGPLTAAHGYTLEQNVGQATRAYLELVALGVNRFCPHLAALLPDAFDIAYERWMAYDFAVIDRSTHVLLLPRWETSGGTVREKAYADRIGKIVMPYEDAWQLTTNRS